jgi:hypothetical protein
MITAYGLPAHAQQQQQYQTTDDAPLNLERREQGNTPDSVIPSVRSGPLILENRQHGHTSAEVKAGRSTYHLKPNTSAGSVPGDAQSHSTRGAQWQLLEFDP